MFPLFNMAFFQDDWYNDCHIPKGAKSVGRFPARLIVLFHRRYNYLEYLVRSNRPVTAGQLKYGFQRRAINRYGVLFHVRLVYCYD